MMVLDLKVLRRLVLHQRKVQREVGVGQYLGFHVRCQNGQHVHQGGIPSSAVVRVRTTRGWLMRRVPRPDRVPPRRVIWRPRRQLQPTPILRFQLGFAKLQSSVNHTHSSTSPNPKTDPQPTFSSSDALSG